MKVSIEAMEHMEEAIREYGKRNCGKIFKECNAAIAVISDMRNDRFQEISDEMHDILEKMKSLAKETPRMVELNRGINKAISILETSMAM